jgi:hypothetical protein
VGVKTAALVALPTCDDVEVAVRRAAKHAMSKLMADKLEATLTALEDERCWADLGVQDGGVAYSPTEDGSGATGSGPSAVSETNNQVQPRVRRRPFGRVVSRPLAGVRLYAHATLACIFAIDASGKRFQDFRGFPDGSAAYAVPGSSPRRSCASCHAPTELLVSLADQSAR